MYIVHAHGIAQLKSKSLHESLTMRTAAEQRCAFEHW